MRKLDAMLQWLSVFGMKWDELLILSMVVIMLTMGIGFIWFLLSLLGDDDEA